MNHYAPDVTYEGAATGANKVWQCAAMAARGFLTQDPAKLDMAVKGLETEFKTVTTSDGFTKTVRSYSTSGILIPEATGARCSKTWST